MCSLVHCSYLRRDNFFHGLGARLVCIDAAEAMRPLAGDYAFVLFAFGLFNASLFAASILPLSTAYTVCEGLGLNRALTRALKRHRSFIGFTHC